MSGVYTTNATGGNVPKSIVMFAWNGQSTGHIFDDSSSYELYSAPTASITPLGAGYGTTLRFAVGADGEVKMKGAPNVGRASLTTMTDANYTLAATEQRGILEVPSTLTLTAPRNVVVPTKDGYEFVAANLSVGGQAVTFKTSGGAGVAVAAGKRQLVYCDGTNVVACA